MPDYDPKSIPILDDIVEKVKTTETSTESGDVNVDSLDKVNVEGAIKDLNENISEDGMSPPFTPDYLKKESAEATESALITYEDNEEDADPVITGDSNASAEASTASTAIPAPVSPISIQEITDEIITKLMPDLETRLRTLVQQTLTEKLPDEIIKTNQTSTLDDD